ncbi:MAG: D-tyrosyl-tRNA(Tyr) deacylase [Verrucomicrobia bacterium]|jgi:D-tyrosyl-tRNA(Tyr) deacylase|nr:D-tyrosyl-tRNA(Tyr) deacylase [Verrucomicrobiota bacterium]
MRAVIQRVSEARVVIGDAARGQIGRGLLVLVAVEDADTEADLEWLSGKIARLRIFNDAAGVMNLSVAEIGGEVLVVSQFTLFASTRKGNRPSYVRSAKPEVAIPLYEKFVARLAQDLGRPVQTGEFGARMTVSLVNDGPVTLIMDSKQKE